MRLSPLYDIVLGVLVVWLLYHFLEIIYSHTRQPGSHTVTLKLGVSRLCMNSITDCIFYQVTTLL